MDGRPLSSALTAAGRAPNLIGRSGRASVAKASHWAAQAEDEGENMADPLFRTATTWLTILLAGTPFMSLTTSIPAVA
jgi:hypothetical protein